MKLWSLIPQADRVKQSRGLRKYSSGPTHSLCVCLSRPVCVDRSTSLGGSRNEANQLAPCGPIDDHKKECPVQLRVHLSPPSNTLKPSLSVSPVFPEPVVAVMTGILNTCTPASWAFPPPSFPSLFSHLHLKCSCSGPKRGGAKWTGHLLVWSSSLSQTKSEAPLYGGPLLPSHYV
ncbi:uncharacterized protein LOC144376351 isoform X1 [Ictidomys tridecemlineatus]